MIRKIINCIPNTITLMNLLSGVLAIIFAFNFSKVYSSLMGWQLCCLMIGAAAVFDFCDGAAARLLNAKSNIGKELDSLADLVSFGVAPALLIFNILPDDTWVKWVALFIPLMGALRLAKFNVDTRQTTSFLGLPIPANAIFWIGVAAWMIEAHKMPSNLLIILVVLIGLLMVSELPMFSLKFSNFKPAENAARYFIIVATIVCVIALGLRGLALAIGIYILMSAISRVVKVTR